MAGRTRAALPLPRSGGGQGRPERAPRIHFLGEGEAGGGETVGGEGGGVLGTLEEMAGRTGAAPPLPRGGGGRGGGPGLRRPSAGPVRPPGGACPPFPT